VQLHRKCIACHLGQDEKAGQTMKNHIFSCSAAKIAGATKIHFISTPSANQPRQDKGQT